MIISGVLTNTPIPTVTKDFSSKDEVLIWIITTQVARRNLSPRLLSYYRGLHYRADKKDLVTLASASKDEVEEIAMKIEEGNYERRKPGQTASTGPVTQVDSVISGLQPLDKAIGKAADAFAAGLSSIKHRTTGSNCKKHQGIHHRTWGTVQYYMNFLQTRVAFRIAEYDIGSLPAA